MSLAALFKRRHAALIVAVVASAFVHLFALFAHKIDLSRPQDLAKLEARLLRPAPDAKPGEAAPNDLPPKPPVPKNKPDQAPQSAVAEATDPPIETPPEPQPEPEPEKTPETPPQVETPPVAEAPKAVGYTWPRAGRIRYLLFGGEGRDPEGTSNAELSWTIDADGKYRFKLESQDAKPFPSMPWFKISFSYSSQGVMIA